MKKHVYRHAKELQESLDKIVHTEHAMQDQPDPNSPMAFVTRNGQLNSSYKIYISRFVQGDALKLHEYGHVVFQHLRYEKILENQTADKVKKVWPKLKKNIEFDSSDFDTENITFRNIVHTIQNFAMDMEVNSKVFDLDEKSDVDWEATVSEFEKLKYYTEQSGDNFKKKKLKDFIERYKSSKKREYLFRLIWPDEYNFPLKLHWQSYVDLILQKPEEFIEDIKNHIQGMQGIPMQVPGDATGRVGSGEASLADKLVKSGKNPFKLKASDLQKLVDELDNEFNNEKSAENFNPDGIDDVKVTGVPHHEHSTKAQGFGHYNGILQKIDVTPFDKKVSQWIYARVLKDVKNYRTDYLYNYNRGKTDKVMRGHSTEYNIEYPSDCYVLVDTSGSVGAITLNKLVKLFDKIKDQVGPKSKVIWWDTDLQRIDSLRHIKNAPNGFGTHLAPALEFMNKFVRKEDKVFIVSDFYDSISCADGNYWNFKDMSTICTIDELYKNFKAQLYGIKWIQKDWNGIVLKEGVLKKEFLNKLPGYETDRIEYISTKMDVLCVVTD